MSACRNVAVTKRDALAHSLSRHHQQAAHGIERIKRDLIQEVQQPQAIADEFRNEHDATRRNHGKRERIGRRGTYAASQTLHPTTHTPAPFARIP